MNKKIPVIVAIIGIVVSVVGIYVGSQTQYGETNNTVTQNPEININISSDPAEKPITEVEIKPGENPSEDPELEKRRIGTDISEMLHDKITNDVLFVQKELNSKEIQEPFDWKVLDDDKFISCGDEGSSNIKCPILKKISQNTDSAYAFLFYYPDRAINNTEIKTEPYCIIEISTLKSSIVEDVTNKWEDRQWCKSNEYILMTDLYHPRNKPTINVTSLLIEYTDSNGDKLGLVNAYNLEKSIGEKMMNDHLPTFNVILLDDKNCVAAAVSKTNGKSTIHMDEGIWQLSEEKVNDALNIFEVKVEEKVKNKEKYTNCDQGLEEYNLDAIETIELSVTENSKDDYSKLDGAYSIFELIEVTNKDLGTTTQIDVFHDWHLLVSIP